MELVLRAELVLLGTLALMAGLVALEQQAEKEVRVKMERLGPLAFMARLEALDPEEPPVKEAWMESLDILVTLDLQVELVLLEQEDCRDELVLLVKGVEMENMDTQAGLETAAILDHKASYYWFLLVIRIYINRFCHWAETVLSLDIKVTYMCNVYRWHWNHWTYRTNWQRRKDWWNWIYW